MDKALLVDGNSIINRAFFAIRGMTNSEGFPTNAIFGFMNTLDMVKEQLNPKYLAVCFDLKGGTFRNKMYSEYKANRTGMDSDLAVQLPVVKSLLIAMGISIVELEGFEADDLLGTLSHRFSDNGKEVYILTGDKDALQLVGENRYVYYHGTKNKIIYDSEKVLEDMGVEPERITDLKGLMGDSSDNIPGIKGVGQKTALKLLEEFNNVENLIKNSEEISSDRIKKLVREHSDMAVLSKQLATIETNVPIDFLEEEYLINPQNSIELFEILKHYELNVLAKRHGTKNENIEDLDFENAVTGDYSEALNEYDFNDFIYFDLIKDSKEPISKKFDYICIYQKDKHPIFSSYKKSDKLFDTLKEKSEKFELKLKGDSLKTAMLLLKANGIENFKPVFDLSIGAYLIDPNKTNHEIADLSPKYLSKNIPRLSDIYEQGKKTKSAEKVDEEKLKNSLSARLIAISKLEELLLDELKKMEMLKLYNELELPLSRVLVDMQFNGFKIDVEELDKIDKELTSLIKTIEAEIYFLAGQDFNINSPKQLGVILFENLGIKGGKKTKTGYSTSKEILEKRIKSHPIIEKILEYRTYTKLKSTYSDGLKHWISKETACIHSYLEQTVVATGRISSRDPNLQNIPVRYEMGRKLRKVFVASSEENILVGADYSQIELRLLAHLSGDEKMIEAYNNGIDIHSLTASKILGKKIDELTKEERSSAKAINFGLIYGMGEFSLSEDLGISFDEAKKYIENYFAEYPKIKNFLEACKESAFRLGYSQTLYGRKRGIPELKNNNFNIKKYGERIAMNTPIQGTSADIIKIAMIKVHKELKRLNLKSRLILQVHDELIIDAPKDEEEKIKDLLKDCMTNAAELSVPLVVEVSSGKSWFETK